MGRIAWFPPLAPSALPPLPMEVLGIEVVPVVTVLPVPTTLLPLGLAVLGEVVVVPVVPMPVVVPALPIGAVVVAGAGT